MFDELFGLVISLLKLFWEIIVFVVVGFVSAIQEYILVKIIVYGTIFLIAYKLGRFAWKNKDKICEVKNAKA